MTVLKTWCCTLREAEYQRASTIHFLSESVLRENDSLEKIKKIVKKYKRCCTVRVGEEEGRQKIDEKERTNRSKDRR